MEPRSTLITTQQNLEIEAESASSDIAEILAVDDESFNLFAVGAILTSLGATSDTAMNGTEAI